MLLHSRGGTGERRKTDLNALVEEALNLAFHGARAQRQELQHRVGARFRRAESGRIEIVPQDITRVLLNLFGNGFYAADKRRRDGDGPGIPAGH